MKQIQCNKCHSYALYHMKDKTICASCIERERLDSEKYVNSKKRSTK